MLAIRAGNVREIYNAKAVRRTILDIISFTDGMYENISEYNLMADIIPELRSDSKALQQRAAAKFDSLFVVNNMRFKNYLLDHVVRINGEVEPISRWTKFHKIDYSEVLRKLMQGASVSSEDYRRTYYDDGDFETYAMELFAKMNKINSAIAIAEARRNTASVGTINGLNMRRGKWNRSSYGVKKESEVLTCMRVIGYEITVVSRLEKMVDACIKVSGVPDGFIVDSPIAQHRGAYLEVKAKPYRMFSKVDEYQLYTYWFLTGAPVLLVNCVKNKIEYRLYSAAELQYGWDKIVGIFLINAHRLMNTLTITDANKYSRLLRIMNTNGGSKLTDRIAF